MKIKVFKYWNRPKFYTKDVKVGKNVSFGKNVVFKCKTVRIGDGVHFGSNISIQAEHFEIGDYGTIYDYCFFPGGTVKIGHNFWLGYSSIVDGRGGTCIGNNVGIGAQSQVWTHMAFGDIMYGCRFFNVKSVKIEDDVWLVGHCLVSPVKIGCRSLAMLGSLITKDMESDHIYAGVPAKDVTDKFGPQFRATTLEERNEFLQKRLDEFADKNKIHDLSKYVKVVMNNNEMKLTKTETTVLNIADRTYLKTGSAFEYKLVRFLLPDIKFIPTCF